MKRTIFIVFFALFFVFQSFSEDSTWKNVEFPQWSRDLRRTEIITLGSLPFVTLWTTLGYSIAVYGEFRNPLDKSTDSFTSEDQKHVIAISAGVCVALGLTDLALTLIKRHSRKKSSPISPISAEPLPQNVQNEINENRDYFFKGVIESAVF